MGVRGGDIGIWGWWRNWCLGWRNGCLGVEKWLSGMEKWVSGRWRNGCLGWRNGCLGGWRYRCLGLVEKLVFGGGEVGV